jgi:hypothetical protein
MGDDEPTPGYTLTVDLPAGAVAQHGLAIASFFDAEGNTRYGLTLEGDAALTSILGLLELVKARVLKEAEGW